MAGCKRRLFIDLETFSSVDISKAGAYPYAESPDFEILLLAYAWDENPVRVIDFNNALGTDDPELSAVLDAIEDKSVVKVAHNCAFERACLQTWLGVPLPPEEWEDTMVLAAMNGLPLSLDAAGAALGIEMKKDKAGAALISYFCKPCKPTAANGHRTRNLPEHDPEKWRQFISYNRRDVEAEREIYYRLRGFPVTDFERSVFALDAGINERGVLVDMELARAAVDIDEAYGAKAEAALCRLTGLDNPNSVSQLKDWLDDRGYVVESLSKAAVADMLEEASDPVVSEVLQLRQRLGKTSTAKYAAMLRGACMDGRVRGITQYYGSRTGRWAGRLVQLQNLPQNHLDNIATVRELVRARDLDTLELCFDSVPDVLSQLIRTAFIAREGHTFLVADYSAIEARVIAYLAGEKWRMDVFAAGGDIYCSSASAMFKVPVEKHGVNGHLRQKGKIAELACGYGGGVGALKNFGADKMGLSEQEMTDIVSQWRAASPRITKFWRDVETAARSALGGPGRAFAVPCGVKFRRDKDALRCRLPSGRLLSYWGARLDDDGHIVFMSQNQTSRRWEPTETWGGKLVENIVQAVARDCLAAAMLRLDKAGYRIVFHVHDEIICEAPEGSRWEAMAEVMSQPVPWAPGLLLRADGYETKFYMKD